MGPELAFSIGLGVGLVTAALFLAGIAARQWLRAVLAELELKRANLSLEYAVDDCLCLRDRADHYAVSLIEARAQCEEWRREAVNAKEALRIERWQHLESLQEAEALFMYGSTDKNRALLAMRYFNLASMEKLIALLKDAGWTAKQEDEETT